jgi:hypothetical protein
MTLTTLQILLLIAGAFAAGVVAGLGACVIFVWRALYIHGLTEVNIE